MTHCKHEEADTCLFVHVYHAAQAGHSNFMICTTDSDVVVLAVAVANELKVKLWIEFGKGKVHRYIAAHDITHNLGAEKSKALPVFHAFIGCDTVSSFHGIGKKNQHGKDGGHMVR